MPVPDQALDALRRLASLLEGLTDAQVGEPSRLPDWTRGHVLAHLAGATNMLARQAEYAVRSEQVEVYSGGRPQRNLEIETYSGRSADEHRTAVADAVRRLETAWKAVEDWSAPVTYRDGSLLGTAEATWREAEIHAHDLALGPVVWTLDFVDHAVDFLAVRVAGGLTLKATDVDRIWELGGGGAAVEGTAQDLALWLAGREPDGALTGEVPELSEWP
ncbi:maleylpyruvate isomerase family mycothiol-dependent enzyme [Actinosynnema sp. NPDC020468]|uniref:maleylpyruvate isomerase family mycothiol-dependent enzyme n=1 Tax=Actinosynnema sp. NPDC020468 TaxID=3154488 RepID=UPI0034010171